MADKFRKTGPELVFDPELAARFETAFRDGKPLPSFEEIAEAKRRWSSLGGLATPVFEDTESSSPRILLDVKKHPLFNGLDKVNQWGAINAETMLNLAQGFGYIVLSRATKMLDFGAGSGGPTLALSQLAEANGGEVTATEANNDCALRISGAGILPAGSVHSGDGLVFLEDNTGFDLITAFMLGPDFDGNLSRRLLAVAGTALNPGGSLVITSDVGTMAQAHQAVSITGLPYDEIKGVPLESGPMPDALIIHPSGA